MKKRFITLCYHYIRPDFDNPFPKILGTKKSDFIDHINFIKKKYHIDEPENILDFNLSLNYKKKVSILFTFDDGLSDQFEAGKILREHDIRAIFFIPSCIVQDKLPSNPIIIHYALALYGLDKFITKYNDIAKGLKLDRKLLITEKRSDDDFYFISEIKKKIYYNMSPNISRIVLLEVYKDLSADFGLNLSDMHLSDQQIQKLLEMGHIIGTHSRNHVSMLNPFLSDKEFTDEFIDPKYTLEDTFNTEIDCMSYTYGDVGDFSRHNSINPFRLIFSVEPRLNTKQTSRDNIGRYEIHSKDTADKLKVILENIT